MEDDMADCTNCSVCECQSCQQEWCGDVENVVYRGKYCFDCKAPHAEGEKCKPKPKPRKKKKSDPSGTKEA